MSSISEDSKKNWKGRRIDLATFSRDVARRRKDTGITDLPRNSGKNRTDSKKALLKAIEDIGGKW